MPGTGKAGNGTANGHDTNGSNGSSSSNGNGYNGLDGKPHHYWSKLFCLLQPYNEPKCIKAFRRNTKIESVATIVACMYKKLIT